MPHESNLKGVFYHGVFRRFRSSGVERKSAVAKEKSKRKRTHFRAKGNAREDVPGGRGRARSFRPAKSVKHFLEVPLSFFKKARTQRAAPSATCSSEPGTQSSSPPALELRRLGVGLARELGRRRGGGAQGRGPCELPSPRQRFSSLLFALRRSASRSVPIPESILPSCSSAVSARADRLSLAFFSSLETPLFGAQRSLTTCLEISLRSELSSSFLDTPALLLSHIRLVQGLVRKKPGIQNKTVTITANTYPKQQRIKIKANVTPATANATAAGPTK